MRYKRVCLIVLDSVGIGELPDAKHFGDQGAHTLGHIAERMPSFLLGTMKKMGLGNITHLPGIEPVENPVACFGKMAEVSVGKDTMTGHWELMGLKITSPFNVYPDGFPSELIHLFEERTGRKVIGNKAASGTNILDELGEEQIKTGAWIVYTSADSVFQIAAHEETIPLQELYDACEIARELTLQSEFSVGRVIARPYTGMPGGFTRTANRHDYAVPPPAPTLMNAMKDSGLDVIAVGKINDIFCGEGITKAIPTKNNLDGIMKTISLLNKEFTGLLFTNLVDFDSLYGHRRDPEGYAMALEQFDALLPYIMEEITADDLLIITADHGNDPTHSGTDHTREYVPVLLYSPAINNPSSIGVRETFSDLAATLAENFNVPNTGQGTSFYDQL
ncbi:phosphopentomutase [Paenibacillus sp. ClWae2A]|uniref:phosphopentomutase n=1 Tax=Paenibacillus sp. ClWae2A TaxID=3057177 RepID=UPI0028F5DDCF|nr:phosphopentomutase [Paenibacillus sp. ClWae2A]MDT9719298.1 phosphopentomutase [Paenibacillus sp. ClWae2A]